MHISQEGKQCTTHYLKQLSLHCNEESYNIEFSANLGQSSMWRMHVFWHKLKALSHSQSLLIWPRACCNLSGGIAMIVWFTTNGMCMKNNTIIYVARASNSKRDCKHDLYCCLLPRCKALRTCCSGFPYAHAARDFHTHMPLGISDRNKMVLSPRCGGHAEFSLHTKNVRSVWFVVKRRGCCCNLSDGTAMIVWFTTNGMCTKNNTIIYVVQASNSKRDCEHLCCCLLPQCLRTSFAHMPLGISNRNRPNC